MPRRHIASCAPECGDAPARLEIDALELAELFDPLAAKRLEQLDARQALVRHMIEVHDPVLHEARRRGRHEGP
jgi:hypothetical protein